MKRIVIADDSSTARMFIRRCLEFIGFREATFIEAKDGQEALNQMKNDPPDLLITDLNMPNMDGAALLKRVKASPRLTNLPVLVISSAGNPAKEEELMALGAFAVMSKPPSPANLLAKLQPLLQ